MSIPIELPKHEKPKQKEPPAQSKLFLAANSNDRGSSKVNARSDPSGKLPSDPVPYEQAEPLAIGALILFALSCAVSLGAIATLPGSAWSALVRNTIHGLAATFTG